MELHGGCDGTMEEASRETLIADRGVELVTSTCSACGYSVNTVEVADRATMDEVEELIGDVYRSFYEEPRSVSHFTLDRLTAFDDRAVTLFLGDVVDLAVEDADDGREPRDVEEITEVLLG